MKKISTTLVLLLAAVFVFAQSEKQVKWTFSSKKIAEGTYEVQMVADVSGNWHIYAQNAGDGPVATQFDFTKNPLLTLKGPVKENGQMTKKYEEAFKSEVRYYEKKVSFTQVVNVKGKAKTNLAGNVEFMVCNDRECLPPSTVSFRINIGG